MKGKYTPKKKFINFVTAKGNMRFHTETATLDASQLSGMLEDVKIRLTIYEDGSIDFDEVDTNECDEAMKLRLIEELEEKNTSRFAQKTVISSIRFKTDDDKLVFLEVDPGEKPINKLKSLMTETKVEVSDKAKSFLGSLFSDEEDETDLDEETQEETQEEIQEVESEKEQVPYHVQMMQEALEENKRNKIKELETRLDKQQNELKKSRFQKSTAESNIKKAEEEIRILNSRLDSVKPNKEANGIAFYVATETKSDITPDENTIQVIEKLAPHLRLNVPVILELLTQGFYDITLAPKTDIESEQVDSEFITDVVEQLDPLGKFELIASNKIRYSGEMKWHQIVGKMIKLGFEQVPDFDKLCGSPSYSTESEVDGHIDEETEMREEAREEFQEITGYECGTTFIFAMTNDPSQLSPSNTMMAIQPKSYWDNEGCQYDQHSEYLMDIKGFDEEMESTFTHPTHTNVTDIIDDLVNQGVKFDVNFQAFMDNNFQVNGQTIEQYMRTNHPNSIV